MIYNVIKETDNWLVVYLVDETDGKTPETGYTVTTFNGSGVIQYAPVDGSSALANLPTDLAGSDFFNMGKGLYAFAIGLQEFLLDVDYVISLTVPGAIPRVLKVNCMSNNPRSDVAVMKPLVEGLPADTEGILNLVKGLLGINSVIDDMIYDSTGKATSAYIYIYETKTDAQTHDKATGLLEKVEVSANITSGNTTLIKSLED